MTPKRKKGQFALSGSYSSVDPELEDEILEVYTNYMDSQMDLKEVEQDLALRDLPQMFSMLNIPSCFTKDIEAAIDYYYDIMKSKKSSMIDRTNRKQNITMYMIEAYTITPSSVKVVDDVLDIVDIDKLINNLNRLLKFRNNYSHIRASWALFFADGADYYNANHENYKLDLPGLKAVKTKLGLDNDLSNGGMISDSFLIDMLGCSQHDSKDRLLNFDFDQRGACVTIKDFAEILGRIGEYD
ncbi:hypothetical protein PVL30_003557 [Lodderomyces elongisporus]|uniref:uncharacterized protein n=1 Tax=Lodderomyces elongisporus TaxID=36914 RepID=UPI00291F14D5|nr:uncharacterized protein PVL30_003557 [Lodderomyces elongisporus]WLF79791.1 hypothetical protein PVL30_003557 [Lodderomyces elongisporus]